MNFQKINFTLLLLPLLTLSFTSCKKPLGKQTTVDVLVRNAVTDEPFEGALVEVTTKENGFMGGYMTTVVSDDTDNNGKTYLEFKAKRKGAKHYYINVKIPTTLHNYSDYRWVNGPIAEYSSSNYITKHQHNDITVEYAFFAALNTRIINESCEGMGDTLFYHITHNTLPINYMTENILSMDR